ncbi:MAG: hypothetical protein Rubg2KO_15240 [Rubricoccaceae bacterium]
MPDTTTVVPDVDPAALKAEIKASPFSISQVAIEAGKPGIGGYEFVRRILSGDAKAAPSLVLVRDAFDRLMAREEAQA